MAGDGQLFRNLIKEGLPHVQNRAFDRASINKQLELQRASRQEDLGVG
jgi:hypothetical protein